MSWFLCDTLCCLTGNVPSNLSPTVHLCQLMLVSCNPRPPATPVAVKTLERQEKKVRIISISGRKARAERSPVYKVLLASESKTISSKPEASRGIKSVVKELLKAGIIRESPHAPCNTPIFPVQKANKLDWRMIQDLRSVNEAVQTRAPLVPDPHTFLNSSSPNRQFYTVTDRCRASFAVPIHTDSQFWFAFS